MNALGFLATKKGLLLAIAAGAVLLSGRKKRQPDPPKVQGEVGGAPEGFASFYYDQLVGGVRFCYESIEGVDQDRAVPCSEADYYGTIKGGGSK